MTNDFTIYIMPIIDKCNEQGISVQTLTFVVQKVKALKQNVSGLSTNVLSAINKMEKILFQTVSSGEKINDEIILAEINKILHEILDPSLFDHEEEQIVDRSIYINPIIGKISKEELNIKTIASAVEELKNLYKDAKDFDLTCYSVLIKMEKELYKAIYSSETINEQNISEELKQIIVMPKKLEAYHKVNQGLKKMPGITSNKLESRNIVDIPTARTNLFKLISQALTTYEPITITSEKGNVVLITEEVWKSMKEA